MTGATLGSAPAGSRRDMQWTGTPSRHRQPGGALTGLAPAVWGLAYRWRGATLDPMNEVPLRNVERFSGFAKDYDTHRPDPPPILLPILVDLLGDRPRLVVDLGSGTGLSTRFWASQAERVLGIEPNRDMRLQAEGDLSCPNVRYREGTSDQTGLPDQCADIVTCSQSLHWMDPQPTFREVARILRRGGVFAAFDYDWPPTTGVWEADAAYLECMARVSSVEARIPDSLRAKGWSKGQHLQGMRDSRRFRFVKEITVHHTTRGHADAFVGLLLSQGGVQSLLRAGHSADEMGVTAFADKARAHLGREERTWYWSSRARIGIV